MLPFKQDQITGIEFRLGPLATNATPGSYTGIVVNYLNNGVATACKVDTLPKSDSAAAKKLAYARLRECNYMHHDRELTGANDQYPTVRCRQCGCQWNINHDDVIVGTGAGAWNFTVKGGAK